MEQIQKQKGKTNKTNKEKVNLSAFEKKIVNSKLNFADFVFFSKNKNFTVSNILNLYKAEVKRTIQQISAKLRNITWAVSFYVHFFKKTLTFGDSNKIFSIMLSSWESQNSSVTLEHGNKAKPICNAIRPSLKFLKVSLNRNKAKLENFYT